MTEEVFSTIAKYCWLIRQLPFSAGDDPRIIFKAGGRCYMTAKGADFSDISPEDIIDVTDHDQSQLLAAAALMRSDLLSAMILCEPPYTEICIDSHHEIPAVLDDMAQIVGPAVRIVEPDVGQVLRALSKSTSVMIENGCLIAGGRNLFEAYTAVQIIEKSAETVLKAQVIGGVKPLSSRLAHHMHDKFQQSYSKEEIELQNMEEHQAAGDSAAEESDVDGYAPEEGVYMPEGDEYAPIEETQTPQGKKGISILGRLFGSAVNTSTMSSPVTDREQMLRELLVEYGNRLVEAGLVQGTWGNLSVMLDRETMLCTPSGLDYDRLKPEDMVRVSINSLRSEGIHKPTSEKSMHAGIYRQYPDANAVIHTHSKYCSVFAASEMPLQIESADKIEKLGEIIGVSRYALAGTNGITRNAVRAMRNAPGCILSHHGMIARGADLEEAFENVRLIEEAAEEYINGRWEK